MSIFEITMLVCFGAAWPFSIYRSYKSRTTKGKSLAFMFIVLVGYVAGVLHKVLFNFDFVIILYALNGVMVSVDIGFWFRNRRIDREISI